MIAMKRALSLLGLSTSAVSGGLVSVALTSLPVDATPPPAVFKDSAGNIYIHSGVTAGQKLAVTLVGQPYKKTIKAAACGQITVGPIANSGNTVTISGTTIDLTKISIANPAPKCTSGTYSPVPTSNFATSKGKFELIGYTAGQSYPVTFDNMDNHFNATVNGCGFAEIKSTTNHPLTTT